jgi:dTDP-L-rhamnose 4-epimerase
MLLEAGYEVRVLDTLSVQVHGHLPSALDWLGLHERLEFQRGSVTSRSDILEAISGMDAVIHLASETGTGQSMYEVERYCHENVMGTALLMDILADRSAHAVQHVLLSSSRSVYGEGAYLLPESMGAGRIVPSSRAAEDMRNQKWEPVCPSTRQALTCVATQEDDRTMPVSIYAATKLLQEDLVRIGTSSVGIGHTIFRLQNVYGEGQSLNNPYTGILSIFSTRIRRGLKLPIFEDGAETRDFVHVSDVARAFVAAVGREIPVNNTINVGSGVGTTVLDVANELSRAFDAEPNTEVTGQFRVGDIRHNRADVSRLKNLLGVVPQVDLQQGLKRFAEWVHTQPLPEDRLAQANAEMAKRNMMG